MTTTYRISGKIQRLSFSRVSGKDSETGKEYWTLSAHTWNEGMWKTIGCLVSFAPTKEECRKAGLDMGLGPVPMLGAPECQLDGEVRGSDYAYETTGVRD